MNLCAECDCPSDCYQFGCFKEGENMNEKQRHGSPTFYKLLEQMADIHDKKSHDYASNDNPFGNYHFAGNMSKLFDNPDDSGFVGRIGEKLYRLANLENDGKSPGNESIEDTEIDICTIVVLWMASRRFRRGMGEPLFAGGNAGGGKSEKLYKDGPMPGEIIPVEGSNINMVNLYNQIIRLTATEFQALNNYVKSVAAYRTFKD